MVDSSESHPHNPHSKWGKDMTAIYLAPMGVAPWAGLASWSKDLCCLYLGLIFEHRAHKLCSPYYSERLHPVSTWGEDLESNPHHKPKDSAKAQINAYSVLYMECRSLKPPTFRRTKLQTGLDSRSVCPHLVPR